ncbi:MAG: NgoPII family restriction endonuclease [archaeon]
MTTNILKALINIQKYGMSDLSKIVVVENLEQPRINAVGNKLEGYIKDSLCNSFTITDPSQKIKAYTLELSHLGSQNNPPDIIIRGGDAIEVKKIAGFGTSAVPLNSSSPKQVLSCKDPMINSDCKKCEDWDKKDLIYVIGNISGGNVRVLSFIYGDCYCANKEHYDKIKDAMSSGIDKLNMEFSKTKELGRLNKIDPLKITDLRIRGMFQIKPPLVVFSDFIKICPTKKLCVYTILREEKFDSFPDDDKNKVSREMSVTNIKLKDPDNVENELDAKLIFFSF